MWTEWSIQVEILLELLDGDRSVNTVNSHSMNRAIPPDGYFGHHSCVKMDIETCLLPYLTVAELVYLAVLNPVKIVRDSGLDHRFTRANTVVSAIEFPAQQRLVNSFNEQLVELPVCEHGYVRSKFQFDRDDYVNDFIYIARNSLENRASADPANWLPIHTLQPNSA